MDNKKLPPSFIITAFNSIRKFFLRLSKKMTPPGMHIFELVQGFWLAKAIGVASSLGIADLLNEKPLSVELMAEKTKTNPEYLYRLLRMLAGEGIFLEKTNKVFANHSMSSMLIEEPYSRRYIVEHQTSENSWKFMSAL